MTKYTNYKHTYNYTANIDGVYLNNLSNAVFNNVFGIESCSSVD